MWQQYKSTFLWIQSVIGLVTWMVYDRSRWGAMAVTYFFIMQVGAVMGAAWALRLRRKAARIRGIVPR
jgi:uncharacterized membrane protein YqjE